LSFTQLTKYILTLHTTTHETDTNSLVSPTHLVSQTYTWWE